MGDLPSPDIVPSRDIVPSPPQSARPRWLTAARVRPALPWLVALAAVLLMLMMMAGIAVRRHVSLAAPIAGSPTTATAAPVPPPAPQP